MTEATMPLDLDLVEIRDEDGNPIEGAELDIWQTAPNGMYSSQDPDQDTYSFHGIQTTGPDGHYGFTTVKPVSYTVPSDGPVGDILKHSAEELLGMPNFGQTSLQELRSKLQELGLKLKGD